MNVAFEGLDLGRFKRAALIVIEQLDQGESLNVDMLIDYVLGKHKGESRFRAELIAWAEKRIEHLYPFACP